MIKLEEIINNNKITYNIYHKLIKIYSKDTVDNYLDKKILGDLSLCKNKNEKILIWNKYSYYLSTKEHSVYEKYELNRLTQKKEYKYFTSKDEIVHGLHLLSKKELIILKDSSNETSLDIERILASIKTKATNDYILDRLNKFYNNITRTSNNDKKIKEILKKYFNNELIDFNISNDDIIDEKLLIEQIEMYIRYSQSKENFILSNTHLVKFVIEECLGVEYFNEDLINEGKIALIKAVDTFDVRYENKFSTYAYYVIANYIKQKLNIYDNGIILPIQAHRNKYRFINKINELTQILKHTPTINELIIYLEIPEKKVINLLNSINITEFSWLEKIVSYELNDTLPIMLEETIIDSTIDIENQFIMNEITKEVLNKINTLLNEKEKEILFKRTGYNTKDNKIMSLAEIAKEKKVTPEAIRQTETKAIKKLRNSRIKNCNPFL